MLPKPIIDLRPNSCATLATIGDCGDCIEAAVDIVLPHSLIIYSKLVLIKSLHCRIFPPVIKSSP